MKHVGLPGLAAIVVMTVTACTSAVSGHGTPSVVPSTAASPAFSGTRFPRLTAENEFGDPPVTDVCATLGTSMFHGSGYSATVPTGMRAASCTYYLNTTPTDPIVRPQVYVDVFLDDENAGGQADSTIGSYGLQVITPQHAGDACSDQVLTSLLDVDIQAYPGRQTPPNKTLCALASTVAHRAVVVMDDKAIVKRHLAPNSLTTQDLCAAADATTDRVKLPSNGSQLGFQTACHIPTSSDDYWVELRFGIQPSDAQSTQVVVDGHEFAADLDPADGYCRYRWQGPPIPGTTEYEEISVKRVASDPSQSIQGCADVGDLAGQVITSLGRH